MSKFHFLATTPGHLQGKGRSPAEAGQKLAGLISSQLGDSGWTPVSECHVRTYKEGKPPTLWIAELVGPGDDNEGIVLWRRRVLGDAGSGSSRQGHGWSAGPLP